MWIHRLRRFLLRRDRDRPGVDDANCNDHRVVVDSTSSSSRDHLSSPKPSSPFSLSLFSDRECRPDESYYHCLVGPHDPLLALGSAMTLILAPIRRIGSLPLAGVLAAAATGNHTDPKIPPSGGSTSLLLPLPSNWPANVRHIWASLPTMVRHSDGDAINGTTGTDLVNASGVSLSQMAEQLLEMMDTNHDGQVTASELMHFTERMVEQQQQSARSYWLGLVTMLTTEWPLLELKLGYFLWRVAGGTIIILWLLSIVPGRLHGWAAGLLRWPVLGGTYLLIFAQFVVYVVIRIFIRTLEYVVAHPKHRQLRQRMSNATSYEEWYKYASALDVSQKRDRWLNDISDALDSASNTISSSSLTSSVFNPPASERVAVVSSSRYNWSFIRQLRKDLRAARAANDVIRGLAVIQQCTRKNVGGIMTEDLFSYSNTGETKRIVSAFIHEVVTTLHWLTDHALGEDKKVHGGDDASENKDEDNGIGIFLEDTLVPSIAPDHDNSEVSYHLTTYQKSDHHDESSLDDHSESIDLNRWVQQEGHKLWDSSLKNIVEEHSCSRDHVVADHLSNGNAIHGHDDMVPIEDDIKDEDEEDDLTIGDGEGQIKRISMVLPLDHPNAPVVTSATATSDSSNDHRARVFRVLQRARIAYGRTAVCLSGGAMLGNYHFGHIIAMIETGTFPHIISGTSAGSVIGSIIATRTDEELKRDLQPTILAQHMTCFSRPWIDRIKGLVTTGSLFRQEDWLQLIRWFAGDTLTFEEAYRKTGRVFCITLSSTTKKAPPVLLNYLSAPNVVIGSAVIASAAVPGFIAPVRLEYKDSDGVIHKQSGDTYYDGSIRQDIPTNGLAEMLNCQFFIACQCNPHIVPFFYNSKGGVGRPCRWSSGKQEDSWRGGFLLAALEMYLKNDMKAKFVFLNDLEASIGFTSNLFTQEFGGSTTIVPQVIFSDYFKLFSDPTLDDIYHYIQGGSIAAYEHVAMLRLHYSIEDALDDCIARFEPNERRPKKRVAFRVPNAKRSAKRSRSGSATGMGRSGSWTSVGESMLSLLGGGSTVALESPPSQSVVEDLYDPLRDGDDEYIRRWMAMDR